MLRPVWFGRDPRNRFGQDFLRGFCVRREMSENGLRGDRLFFDLPAIVISNHRQGGQRDLRFARQLRFGNVGHTDNVESLAPVEFGLGAGRKGRSIHAHVSAAIVDRESQGLGGLPQNVSQTG